MATKQEMINAVLEDLNAATADILGLAVISPDGMMIANRLAAGEADAAAAMAAALGSLGKRVTDTLNAGDLQEISIRGTKVNVIVFDIEHRASLLVEVTADANFGLVLLEARQAKEKLSGII
jgi:hypothetical protein